MLNELIGQQPEVVQSTSTSHDTLVNNIPVRRELPSNLLNGILNFAFYTDDEPVTSGITGTLTLTGYYRNGRPKPLGTVNLATTDTFSLVGKYTDIEMEVTGLSTDNMVVYIDQNINLLSGDTNE